MNAKRLTIDIWDNGGRTADRYAIALTGTGAVNERGCPLTIFLTSSDNPYHPQGVGMRSEITTALFTSPGYGHRDRLGKRIRFDELPVPVQRFVASELMPS